MAAQKEQARGAESRFLLQRGQNRETQLFKGLKDLLCPNPMTHEWDTSPLLPPQLAEGKVRNGMGWGGEAAASPLRQHPVNHGSWLAPRA